MKISLLVSAWMKRVHLDYYKGWLCLVTSLRVLVCVTSFGFANWLILTYIYSFVKVQFWKWSWICELISLESELFLQTQTDLNSVLPTNWSQLIISWKAQVVIFWFCQIINFDFYFCERTNRYLVDFANSIILKSYSYFDDSYFCERPNRHRLVDFD
jgi:hypothetical protein